MTLLSSTFLLYFLVGAGVAVAVYLSDMGRSPAQRGFQTAACLAFWPLFLPLLLQQHPAPRPAPAEPLPPGDELSRAITQVGAELGEALRSMHDCDGVRSHKVDRFGDLRMHWQTQAKRIREMDRLLAQPEYTIPNDAIQAEHPAFRDSSAWSERVGGGDNRLCAIIERLHRVREEEHAELMASLARVRQLAALLHLTRFTGEPASEVAEVFRQLTVEMDRATSPRDTTPFGVEDSFGRE